MPARLGDGHSGSQVYAGYYYDLDNAAMESRSGGLENRGESGDASFEDDGHEGFYLEKDREEGLAGNELSFRTRDV